MAWSMAREKPGSLKIGVVHFAIHDVNDDYKGYKLVVSDLAP